MKVIFKLPGSDIEKEVNISEDDLKLIETYNNLSIVVHKGRPDNLFECSRCFLTKEPDNFNFYNKRIDKKNFLMRSNAICKECAEKINKERKITFQKDKKKIPQKPKSGSVCLHCKREWKGNWHRDHCPIKHEFRYWLCGNCNMAKQDHRNSII